MRGPIHLFSEWLGEDLDVQITGMKNRRELRAVGYMLEVYGLLMTGATVLTARAMTRVYVDVEGGNETLNMMANVGLTTVMVGSLAVPMALAGYAAIEAISLHNQIVEQTIAVAGEDDQPAA